MTKAYAWTIRFEEHQKDYIQRIGDAYNMSIAQVVRTGIDELFRQHEKEIKKIEARKNSGNCTPLYALKPSRPSRFV